MIKYKLLIFLLICIALNSCIDDLETCIDDSDNDIPEVFTDGYALNFKATLDPMGGTRAIGDEENPMAELESYIDPEKFRVLFFDREDRFLFESKSRWVKKIVPNDDNDHAEWFVSVPLYDYGNDEAYNWKWEEIRRVLTGEDMNEDVEHYGKDDGYEFNYHDAIIREFMNASEDERKKMPAFKIAILANRPNTEWNMGITGRTGGVNVTITKNGWQLQNGPFWNNEHTRWGDDNKKTVFDLHHCQYDPIYDGKNYNVDAGINQTTQPSANANGIWKEFPEEGGGWWYQNLDVYGFIAGKVKKGEGFDEYEDRPTMGATSTWVSWNGGDTDKGEFDQRKFVQLDKSHPIPMYGIQEFAAIGEDWVKGTPFNLSHIADGQDESDYDFKSISLLRSVVKLELILSKKITNDRSKLHVAMIYPNVYARCEPMDVWTPTDKIWTDDGTHESKGMEGSCEWYRIRKYGPVSRNKTFTEKASVDEYEKAMSWFYGAWTENGRWPLLNKDTGDYAHGKDLDYPRIFNSCVQRNSTVSCESVDYSHLYNDDSYHFIVYTGEKNINDPSNISLMGEIGNGKAPVISWWVQIEGKCEYGFALAPYEGQYDDFSTAGRDKTYKENSVTSVYFTNKVGTKPTSRFRHYEARVQGYDQSDNQDITPFPVGSPMAPWPLVRNHVYKIRIGNFTRSGGGMSIQTEVLSSKTINFDKPKEEKKEKEGKVTENKKIEKE